MTPEQREKAAADAAISAVLYELQANGVEGEDLQAAAIGALWQAMEDESVGMSKDALKRLIFGEDHIVDANKMVQPDGWKLVPVEPTHMMTLKAEEAFENDGYDYPSMRVIWAAMLAAAPQQPAPHPPLPIELNCVCGSVWSGDGWDWEMVEGPRQQPAPQPLTEGCGYEACDCRSYCKRAHGIGEQP